MCYISIPSGLPAFAVCDLSSLPPLDTKNVDFAHLLGEMRAIRAEMANLRETVAKLSKKEVPSSLAPLIVSPKPPQLPQIGRQPLTTESPQCNGPVSSEMRLKPTYAATISSTVAAIRSSGREDPARSDDGFTLLKTRTRPPALKGRYRHNGEFDREVENGAIRRRVRITTSTGDNGEDMEAFVQETHHLSSKCVKLETKHQSYASFKVEDTCDNVPDI